MDGREPSEVNERARTIVDSSLPEFDPSVRLQFRAFFAHADLQLAW